MNLKLIAFSEEYSNHSTSRSMLGFIKSDGDFFSLMKYIYTLYEQTKELFSVTLQPLDITSKKVGLVYTLTTNISVYIDPATNEPDDFYRRLILVLCEDESASSPDGLRLSESESLEEELDYNSQVGSKFYNLTFIQFLSFIQVEFFGVPHDLSCQAESTQNALELCSLNKVAKS